MIIFVVYTILLTTKTGERDEKSSCEGGRGLGLLTACLVLGHLTWFIDTVDLADTRSAGSLRLTEIGDPPADVRPSVASSCPSRSSRSCCSRPLIGAATIAQHYRRRRRSADADDGSGRPTHEPDRLSRPVGRRLLIGVFGLLSRRNVIAMFLAIELMLNAVIINFIAFARFADHHAEDGRRDLPALRHRPDLL